MTNVYAIMLGINTSRKYTVDEIRTYRSLYDELLGVNKRANSKSTLDEEELYDINCIAWKAIREYETKVPEDIQQILSFDTVSLTDRMIALNRINGYSSRSSP